MSDFPELRTALADAAQRHYGQRAVRRSLRRRALSVTAVGVIVLAITLVVVFALPSERERVADRPQESAPAPTTVPGPSVPTSPPVGDAVRRFSDALRSGQALSTGSEAGQDLQQTAADRFGQDLARFEMRRQVVDKTEIAFGIGDRVVCLRLRRPSGAGGMSCAPAASATNPRTPIISTADSGRISGVLLDGVSDLVIDIGSKSVPVPLHGQAFSVDVGGKLDAISYRLPNGELYSLKHG